MKFYVLMYLFKDALTDMKKENEGKPFVKYIVTAYQNVLKNIADSYSDNELVTPSKINALNITKHMKEKLIKLSEKNVSESLLKKINDQKDVIKLRRELNEVLGIGDKKINELIDLGLKNTKQLLQKKWYEQLNTDTQLMVTHKPTRHISYDTLKKLEPKFTNFSKNIVMVGSYRRKKPIARDIDILFMPSKPADKDAYLEYLRKVFKNQIWIYLNGSDKVSLVVKPFTASDVKYKVDIFITTPDNYYSMLLYTTGDKAHNIKMRARAKKLGLLLNQNGIFKVVNKKIDQKINKRTDNEKKLFALLKMDYIEPENRF